MISVIIVEDNKIIRESLVSLINGTDGLSSIASYGDCESLFRERKIENADVVINFCGAGIDKRWTRNYKEELIKSRVNTTSAIVNSIMAKNDREIYLINTSAIGIYSNNGIHGESSRNFEENYLSKIIREWEGVLENQIEFKNYCIIRLGVVLDRKGGFLKKVLLTLRFKLCFYLGDKKNIFSFIDSYDFLAALEFIIEKRMKGICNFVSPKSSTNIEVALMLKKIFKSLLIIKIPDFILKVIFGEGYYSLTKTPKVVPEKLLNSGFVFKFSDIKDSLNSKFVKNLN